MNRLFALVAGIDYDDGSLLPNVPPVQGAEADARSMAALVTARMPSGGQLARMELLLGAKVTVGNLRERLQSAMKELDAADTLLFYFAGHGQRTDDGLAIIAADGRYMGHDLLDDLRGSPAQRSVILDCCHAGAIGAGVPGLEILDATANAQRGEDHDPD